MRTAKLLGALLPLMVLTTGALLVSSACSSTSSPATSPDSGPGDATLDTTTSRDTSVVDTMPAYDVLPYDGAAASLIPQVPRVPVHSETLSQRAMVAQLMFAAGEMQTSGEPFAEFFAGRNLADYDRLFLPVDQYILNNGSTTESPIPMTDLFGFSTAVESYEYSKMHVNMVVQESTAGISLANGPVVAKMPLPDPLGGPGDDAGEPEYYLHVVQDGGTPNSLAFVRLVLRMQDLLGNAGTDVSGYATLPAANDNPANYTGFVGEWVSFVPFSDFDPTMNPTTSVLKTCTLNTAGYGGLPTLGAQTPLYECAYNSTHLPDPVTQVNRVLNPRALGMAAWKEALWGIDFGGRIHDSMNNQVNAVAPADLPLVGQHANTVVGTDPPGMLAPGTYIGSSGLEGMWGLTMIASMDNAAEFLIDSLSTSDGVTLTGFPSKLQALQYDYTSPLTWFPTAIKVTEDDSVVPYPPVTQLTITDPTSYSEDLAALLLGYSLFFGTTDSRNIGLGQKIGFQCLYDGDPFPADNGSPDGEETAHDRSLSVMRVAFVDLDRIHGDPTLGVMHDSATVSGGVVTQAPTVTTSSLAHSVLGMAQLLLSLNAAITQYGAPDTNPLGDAQGELNTLPIHPPGVSPPPNFSARVRSVLTTNATFVRDVLTQANGTVSNGATITNGVVTVDPSPATLQNQAAAARALTEAFVITSDPTFQARARAVIRMMNTSFYSAPARMYRYLAAGPDDIVMTPELFGWLQSSLRETYKVLWVPGDPQLDRNVLQDRIARANKLFLNGWDDLNGDQTIQFPSECLSTHPCLPDAGQCPPTGCVPDAGFCTAGGMQMAEQFLTGETGRSTNGQASGDREQDCVPELAHARVASVLAAQVHFHSP